MYAYTYEININLFFKIPKKLPEKTYKTKPNKTHNPNKKKEAFHKEVYKAYNICLGCISVPYMNAFLRFP